MPCGEYFTSYTDRMSLVRWRIEWATLLLGAPIFFVLPFLVQEVPILSQTLLITMFITAIAVLGLNVMVGYTGELVLAQGAFMAVGAYSTINLINMGLGLLPSVFIGGLLTAVISLIAGLPSYRIKGYYVAVTTLAVQFIADWFFRNAAAAWVTGGSRQPVPVNVGLIGDTFTLESGSLQHYYLMLLLLFFVILLMFNLSRSSLGRSMRAVRDNDLAADVLGIEVFKTKLLAYFIGGFFIGVAGGLWGFHIGIVEPGQYDFSVTIEHYTILILGGLGYVWGALIGTGIIIPFESWLFDVAPSIIETLGFGIDIGGFRATIFGLLIIVILIIEPKGVIALLGQVKEYLRKWPYSY